MPSERKRQKQKRRDKQKRKEQRIQKNAGRKGGKWRLW